MRNTHIRRIVFSAMMAALACVATMVIQIPSPTNGYTNLGDCIVLLCGWLLGPVYGFLSAGIGSAMADLLSGYAHYVPGTFVIKGLMALTAVLLYSALCRAHVGTVLSSVISGLAAEVVMIAGYFGYAALILGNGAAAALASIPSNMVQGALGLLTSVIILAIIKTNKTLRRLTAV